MRVDFVKAMESVLEKDPQSIFVTGDLGYNFMEKIASQYGKRFINAGVAEQNMMGMAAGLALAGYRPWLYSIVPFTTFRCFEQIRNDVCFHNLPVRIVGNGGGFTYGIMGSTHHSLEDLGALKTLPNMQLFFPCSNDHVAAAVQIIQKTQAPTYLRLGISGFNTPYPVISENPETLTRHYHSGKKLTIVGVGHGTQVILAALAKEGLKDLDVDVFGVARLPFNLESDRLLVESVQRSKKVLILEEHYRLGGIGESLQAALPVAKVEIMSAVYNAKQRYGSPAFQLKQCGLSPEAVLKKAQEMIL